MAAVMNAVWLRRIKAPGAETIAILFGLEALSRGTASAVLPIDTVRLMGSDEAVSLSVLAGSIVAIPVVFAAPALARRFGRPGLLTVACLAALIAAILFTLKIVETQVLGFVLRALGVALVSVCLNLFILDYVRRGDLGKSEPLRMLFLGIGWVIGPMLGVFLSQYVSAEAPYYFSGGVMLILLVMFWALRFKSAPGLRRTGNRSFKNPLSNLGEFLRQPRLLHSWLNSTGRAFFWMSFFTYTPIYAVKTGLGEVMAGALLSLGTFGMILMPVWGWLARRYGIRTVASLSFGAAAVGCLAAWGFAATPWLGAAGIVAAALAMAVNDGYGNALFFRACRPSKRDAMTPTFTTYRDVSEISQAASFAILLSFLPIQIVYFVLAVLMAGLAVMSRTIHPRL
jgi:ACDE family multidrug resistance protein